MVLHRPVELALHLGQVVPVSKAGLRDDCDFGISSPKAGHGNDRVLKAWKAKKPAFHPSHTLWKFLADFHIPKASTTKLDI
jgi:hypothetical protein